MMRSPACLTWAKNDSQQPDPRVYLLVLVVRTE